MECDHEVLSGSVWHLQEPDYHLSTQISCLIFLTKIWLACGRHASVVALLFQWLADVAEVELASLVNVAFSVYLAAVG